MAYAIKTKAGGSFEAVVDGYAITLTISDPMPKELRAVVQGHLEALAEAGATELLTERSLGREFTHLIFADGSVEERKANPTDLNTLEAVFHVIRSGIESSRLQITPSQMVDAERDRRILAGATFDVTGYGPVRLAGDRQTRDNLGDVKDLAKAMSEAGDTTPTMGWRDEDNIVHQLTPPQVVDLWLKASTFVTTLYQRAWALKDNPEGVPEDYTDDRHWR